jgi:hypothetical protein
MIDNDNFLLFHTVPAVLVVHTIIPVVHIISLLQCPRLGNVHWATCSANIAES